MNKKFESITGAWSAAPTPLTESLKIDTESVKRMVEHHIRLNQQGIFIGGTCGEGPYLVRSEFRRLTSVVAESAGSDLVVAVQVTDNSHDKVLENIKAAKADGADIAIVAEPWFMGCMNEGAFLKYYLEVVENSELPVGVYSRGAKEVPVKIYEKLLMHPNVCLLKDSSLNDDIMKIGLNVKSLRNDFFLLTGYELGMPPYLKAGYDGILAGGGVLIGHLTNQMTDAAKAGEWDRVEQLQEHCNKINYAAYGGEKITSWLTGLKYTLMKMGIFETTAGYLQYPLSDSSKAVIDAMVEEEKDVLFPQAVGEAEYVC